MIMSPGQVTSEEGFSRLSTEHRCLSTLLDLDCNLEHLCIKMGISVSVCTAVLRGFFLYS